jgi:hypothetical protein
MEAISPIGPNIGKYFDYTGLSKYLKEFSMKNV